MAYQLRIRSDIALPAVQAPFHNTPDVLISSNPSLMLKEPISCSDNTISLVISDIAYIKVSNGCAIEYHALTDNLDLVTLYILGSAMGALLLQRNMVLLHANALCLDDDVATLFTGDSGQGKSTTAAYHYQQGAQFIADDISAISFDEQGVPWVLPGFAFIKLWPSSTKLLNINSDNLSYISACHKKYRIPLTERIATSPKRIGHIIELNPSPKQIIAGHAKLNKLIHHSYRYYFITLMQKQVDYTNALIGLAQHIKFIQQPRPTLCNLETYA